MLLRCYVALGLLCSAAFIRAANSQDSSQFTALISLPPSFIGETNPINQTIKGLSRLEESKAVRFSGTVFDARPFLEKLGIGKIDSVEAVYSLSQKVLLLQGERDQVEQIEGYLMGVDCSNPASLKHEIILVSFRNGGDSLAAPARTYEELRRLAGDSWKELARAEINSKTGMRAETMATDGKVVKDDSAELPNGAQGSVFAVESVIWADGVSMDTFLSFKYRGKPEGLSAPISIQYVGQTNLWNGRPQVLQISPLGNDGRLYALLLRVTMIWPSTERVLPKRH